MDSVLVLPMNGLKSTDQQRLHNIRSYCVHVQYAVSIRWHM